MADRITFAGERTAKAAPDATSFIPLPKSDNPEDLVTIIIVAHPTLDMQLLEKADDDFGILIPAAHGMISLEGWRLASKKIPQWLKAAADATVQVTVVT